MSMIFMIVALILFVLAAYGVKTRFDLGWAGMAFFALSLILAGY